MAAVPEIAFTLADGQNAFFVELAEALVSELRCLGVRCRVGDEYPEVRPGLVHVFLPPHEYVALTGFRPQPALLRRSITISAEQPASGFFEIDLDINRDAGVVYDINPRAVRAYRSEGIACRHLQLGYTGVWDRFQSGERDIDIVFIGRSTGRRGQALASYADVFERFRCHLQISDNSRPSTASARDFVAGDPKRELLSRAKVLLNIHGEDEPYFEHLRAVEAICAGCAIVSEHASDIAPLRWGEDLLTGGIGRLGLLCAYLLDNPAVLDRIRRSAYERIREQGQMSVAASLLAKAAAELDTISIGDSLPAEVRSGYLRHRQNARVSSAREQPPMSPWTPGEGQILRALKRQQLGITNVQRAIASLRPTGARPPDAYASLVYESRGWRRPQDRRLAVIVPLFNHADVVIDALASADAPGVEFVVVDDGSTDGGGDRVSEWMRQNERRPARLVRHDVNAGLPQGRNTGLRYSSSELLLMLDADNQLRSTAIDRLTGALEVDREASFAYGIVEQFSQDGAVGLVSEFPWNPERLRYGNYIDALSLIRREALVALGGYSCDPRLALGWEDYDLWARMAEAGRHAVFVPEIIARYRVGHSSMVSVTNISVTDAYAAIADHAPNLMRELKVPQ